MKTKSITKAVALFLLLAFSTGAMAQKKQADRAKVMTDKMKEQLTLNDVQYKKIYDINADFYNQSKELQSSGTDRAEKLEKLKALSDAKDAQIKPVLTPEQYTTYLENKAANKKKIKEFVQKRNSEKAEKSNSLGKTGEKIEKQ